MRNNLCITLILAPDGQSLIFARDIVFDDYKRDLTLAMRGLDFADLTMDFFERASIVPAKVSRFKAVGEFGGKL